MVPNPYVFYSRFERTERERVIKFTNLPPQGRLRIYTLSGQFAQEIKWGPGDLLGEAGDIEWNLRTREYLLVGTGLYIWLLDSPFGRARGKFVVVR